MADMYDKLVEAIIEVVDAAEDGTYKERAIKVKEAFGGDDGEIAKLDEFLSWFEED